jgi:hypothetical protein
MLAPFRENFKGVNVYRFYLAPFVVSIKASVLPFRFPFKQFALTEGPEVILPVRDYISSKEFSAGPIGESIRDAEEVRTRAILVTESVGCTWFGLEKS